HERLRQAGYPDEQTVAAGEDGDEQLLQYALLADDGLGHLLADAPITLVETLDGGDVGIKARPALGRRGDGGGADEGRLLRLQDDRLLRVGGRQPGAAAAQPPSAVRHLHQQPTRLASDVRHRSVPELAWLAVTPRPQGRVYRTQAP